MKKKWIRALTVMLAVTAGSFGLGSTESRGGLSTWQGGMERFTGYGGAEYYKSTGYYVNVYGENGEITEQAKVLVQGELRNTFRPEFLNRLDETVFFKPLTKDDLTHIIDLLTASLRTRLGEKDLGLEFTDAAKQHIIDGGYDPVYGARPLKRYLQAKAETLIAKKILSGDLPAGATLVVDAREGELTCDVRSLTA